MWLAHLRFGQLAGAEVIAGSAGAARGKLIPPRRSVRVRTRLVELDGYPDWSDGPYICEICDDGTILLPIDLGRPTRKGEVPSAVGNCPKGTVSRIHAKRCQRQPFGPISLLSYRFA